MVKVNFSLVEGDPECSSCFYGNRSKQVMKPLPVKANKKVLLQSEKLAKNECSVKYIDFDPVNSNSSPLCQKHYEVT